MKTQEARARLNAPLMCSTPFGIRDENTRAWRRVGAPRVSCSTPFGIRDENTVTIHGEPWAIVECSTPFGIRDENTFANDKITYKIRQCSTPFGIRDENTERPQTLRNQRNIARDDMHARLPFPLPRTRPCICR